MVSHACSFASFPLEMGASPFPMGGPDCSPIARVDAYSFRFIAQPSKGVRSFRLRLSSKALLRARTPGAKKAPHTRTSHLLRSRVARAQGGRPAASLGYLPAPRMSPRSTTTHYDDVIIVGTGLGGTLAYKLVPSGMGLSCGKVTADWE